ncbi:MAG: AI-2E family transporter [Bdellovibrionia bacterium]
MGRKVFAFLVVAAFFYIIFPLIFPLAMGGVFAVLFMPWVEKLEKKKVSTGTASGLVTLGVTLLILLPTSILIYQGVKSGIEQLQALKESPAAGADWAQNLLSSPHLKPMMEWAASIFPIGLEELSSTLSDFLHSLSNNAAEWLGLLITHLPGMGVALAVIVVSLYFFLVDGRKLVIFARRHSVFSPSQTDQLLANLGGVCRSVVLASVISGLCQATFESAMVFVTGTPNVLLIGVLVFVTSFVPLVGTAPVTFGVALQQFMIGRTAAGIALLISALFVTTMDNFIRPWFLRGSANLHPLLAFAAAFGGLQMLGFSGIFLGPIVAALMVTTIQVLTQTEKQQVSPPTDVIL